ncbi:MAG: sulfurtransferase [Amphritea sp.]
MFTTLINPQQLASLINTDGGNLVILDCRFNLMDTEQGQRLYSEGHIPGARYVHLDNDLSSPITPDSGRHPLPGFDELSGKLSRWGIDADTQVVVYDDCAGAMAGRAWWLLRLLGFSRAAVLDGGFPAWLAAEGAITTALPETLHTDPVAAPSKQQAQSQIQMLASVSQVESLQADQLLVDARTPERYRGEQEPIDPVAGHIPGAVNRPLQRNLDSQGLFKSAVQLKIEWLALLGDKSSDDVIHYCGSGVTACHNYLAMEVAGLTGSRIYAGSWSEWIRNH